MNGCKRQDYNCPVLPLPARVTRVRVALATVCSQITQGFCNLGARNTEKLRVQERKISEQQDIVEFTVSAYSVASCGDVSVSLRVPPMRRTLTHGRLLTVVSKQARKPPRGWSIPVCGLCGVLPLARIWFLAYLLCTEFESVLNRV